MYTGIINSSLEMKVKCLVICRQIFLYLFVSRLVRRDGILKIFSIHSFSIYFSFLYLPSPILAYEMLN